MLIGGHVSPAGGLVNAFHRGVERAYDGEGEPFQCVNPAFFESPAEVADGFDLRDRLL